MRARWHLSLLLATLTLMACDFGWDAYDPRAGTTATTSGSGGEPGAGGSALGGMSAAATGGSGGSLGGMGGASQGGEGGTGGSPPALSVSYPASVAECISPVLLDPDACEGAAGAGHLNVDLEATDGTDTPEQSFLRFDLDDALLGKTVLSATLELVVGTALGAGSDHTGEVWEVKPFTLTDLSVASPGPVGSAPTSADLGACVSGDTVRFVIPSGLVVRGASLYFGIFPLSGNGVNYFNNAGATPPRLLVTYR